MFVFLFFFFIKTQKNIVTALCISNRKFYKELLLKFQVNTIINGSNTTVGSKIIPALAIMLEIFLWFDSQFLTPHACYKECKA